MVNFRLPTVLATTTLNIMHLLNPIRAWLWRVKLNLVRAEIVDVLDDMSAALHDSDLGTYRALADFHTELVCEAQRLQRALDSLNH